MQAKGPYPRTDDYRELEAYWRKAITFPVVTLDVEDEAITATAFDYRTGNVELSTDGGTFSSQTSICDATVITDGTPVQLLFTGIMKPLSGETMNIAFWRDTSSIAAPQYGYIDADLPGGVSCIDYPPAGGGTYTYYLKGWASASGIYVAESRFFVTVMKK
jgi:hypothetical protein